MLPYIVLKFQDEQKVHAKWVRVVLKIHTLSNIFMFPVWLTQFYLCIFSFTQGECVLQAISSESGESLPGNFIGFKSAPDKVVDGSVVRVRYRCLRPCQLAVEVVVSTLRKTDLVVFRRKWISGRLGVYRIHQVPLTLPPSILYQSDFFNRNVLEVDNATVRAWLVHLKNGTEPTRHRDSMLSIYKMLEITPLSERPAQPPTESLSWFARLMWQMTRDRTSPCPHESGQNPNHMTLLLNCQIFNITSFKGKILVFNLLLFSWFIDVIEVLKFPLASTGELFGLVRRFQPFMDDALERGRLHAVTQPRLNLKLPTLI